MPTKEQLVESATDLAPSSQASEQFTLAADAMAVELNRQMTARPDLDRLIGEGNVPMMQDNSRNMARFLASLFAAYDPQVLVDTVLWVFRTYRMHGFQVSYWPANLDTFTEIARKTLSADGFAAVEPVLNWLIINIPAFTDLSDQAIAESR